MAGEIGGEHASAGKRGESSDLRLRLARLTNPTLIWIPLIFLLLGAAIASIYIGVRGTSYEARVGVLVQAQPPDSAIARTNTGVLVETSGTTDVVQTAIGLLHTEQACAGNVSMTGSSITTEECRAMVSVERQGQSRLIAITARSADAQLSARLAQTYAGRALELHNQTVKTRAQRLLGTVGASEEQTRALTLLSTQGDPSMIVIESASTSPRTTSLSPTMGRLLGALVGLLVGAALVYLSPRGTRK